MLLETWKIKDISFGRSRAVGVVRFMMVCSEWG